MRSLLTFWDTMVELAALIAIVVAALGLMMGTIDRNRIWGRLGTTLAALVLLLMLPPILLGIWRPLTLWQQVGIAVVFVLAGTIAVQCLNRRPKKRDHAR